MEPLVSVLLSVRDGEAFIAEAVNSILRQTYQSWELIVIDDGSTDRTAAILDTFSDERIHVYHQKNQGLARSLNRAASYAKGELLARLDADDICSPDRLEKLAAVFMSRPDAALIASDAMVVDEDGSPLFLKQTSPDKDAALRVIRYLRNPFVHGTLAVPKKVFLQVGGYDETFPTSQDFDLVVKLLGCGSLVVLSEPLYKLRLHPESITSRKWRMQIISTCRVAFRLSSFLGLKVFFVSLPKYILIKLLSVISLAGSVSSSLHYYRIGRLHYQKDECQQAYAYYTKALSISPFFIACRLKRYSLKRKLCTS